MSVDTRTAAQQSAITHNIQQHAAHVEKQLTYCRGPSPADSRRLALLTEATGDVAAALTRGQSAESELEALGGQVMSWLLSVEQGRAR